MAATPETVRRLGARGFTLQVERGAGQSAGFPDAAYAEVGAELTEEGVWELVDGVLCVQAPTAAGCGWLIGPSFMASPRYDSLVALAAPSSAATRACHGSVAHFTRDG